MRPGHGQTRSRRRTALLAGGLLVLAWLAVPAEACLGALAQLAAATAGDEAGRACQSCGGEDIAAMGAGHGQCDAAGCVAEAMPPCPAGLDTVPASGGQPPLAVARAGLRLPVSDPHGAPVPPEPPPDNEPSYLRCCILLI